MSRLKYNNCHDLNNTEQMIITNEQHGPILLASSNLSKLFLIQHIHTTSCAMRSNFIESKYPLLIVLLLLFTATLLSAAERESAPSQFPCLANNVF